MYDFKLFWNHLGRNLLYLKSLLYKFNFYDDVEEDSNN